MIVHRQDLVQWVVAEYTGQESRRPQPLLTGRDTDSTKKFRGTYDYDLAVLHVGVLERS